MLQSRRCVVADLFNKLANFATVAHLSSGRHSNGTPNARGVRHVRVRHKEQRQCDHCHHVAHGHPRPTSMRPLSPRRTRPSKANINATTVNATTHYHDGTPKNERLRAGPLPISDHQCSATALGHSAAWQASKHAVVVQTPAAPQLTRFATQKHGHYLRASRCSRASKILGTCCPRPVASHELS